MYPLGAFPEIREFAAMLEYMKAGETWSGVHFHGYTVPGSIQNPTELVFYRHRDGVALGFFNRGVAASEGADGRSADRAETAAILGGTGTGLRRVVTNPPQNGGDDMKSQQNNDGRGVPALAAEKRVILSMGGKGGVGKTSLMAALTEWFDAKEIPAQLLDLDSENKARGSLAHFFGARAPKVNIHTPAGLDAFVDQLVDGAPVILADMGAGSGQVTYDWFDRMYPDVAEAGIAFTAIGVVTSDPASVESVLAWAARLQKRTQYLIVENSVAQHTDFRYWRESTRGARVPAHLPASGDRDGLSPPRIGERGAQSRRHASQHCESGDASAGTTEGFAGHARPELPPAHVRRVRPSEGVAAAMSPRSRSRPRGPHRSGSAGDVRAAYYRELNHCRSLPENDEMLRILRAMQFLTLLMRQVPERGDRRAGAARSALQRRRFRN